MATMTTETIQQVPVADVRAGANDRTVFEDEAILELADSIAADGLAQPITVRPICDLTGTWYEIVAGERRFRAVSRLGWSTIPAIVRELSDEQAAGIMLLENLMRRDLDVIDEAMAYQSRMERFGWTAAELADRVKVSSARVAKRLGLLSLADDVQHMVRKGHLPIGHAELMIGLDSDRQHVAMRLVRDSERMPSATEFKRICGELKEQQAQGALFDLEAFFQAKSAELVVPPSRDAGLKVDDRLPKLAASNKDNTGRALKTYVEQLEAAGFHSEALAVSTALAQLIRGNWTNL